MKNHWLDKNKDEKIEEKVFLKYVLLCQDAEREDYEHWREKLEHMLKILATKVIAFFQDIVLFKKTPAIFEDKDSIIEDCVDICFEKLDRFDHTKGKTINYFTTIMLCHMRQLYRSRQQRALLKEKK